MLMTFNFSTVDESEYETQDNDAEIEEEEDESDNLNQQEGNIDDTTNDPDMDIVHDDGFQPIPTPTLNNDDETSLIENNINEDSTELLTQFNDEWQLTFNDNWFEFNHRWPSHQQDQELFELDDLPDPRLYDIDVKQLRLLARQKCDECGGLFDLTYEDYLIQVEPVYLTQIMTEYYVISNNSIIESNGFNLMNKNFKQPNPMMFFPPALHSEKRKRKQQINTALNKFVIVLEMHIEGKTWYDTLDNVYWGIGTGEPSPKLSWLRYIRWRRYFLHLKLSGITQTAPDLDEIKSGPPNLRNSDRERMSLTNCFALSIKTGQFEANNVGCHSVYDPESPFPQFPNVKDGFIALYQFKSIWTLDLNDYDCNTAWNNSFSLYQKPWPKMCCMSLRQDKLRKFIDNRRAKWGGIPFTFTSQLQRKERQQTMQQAMFTRISMSKMETKAGKLKALLKSRSLTKTKFN